MQGLHTRELDFLSDLGARLGPFTCVLDGHVQLFRSESHVMHAILYGWPFRRGKRASLPLCCVERNRLYDLELDAVAVRNRAFPRRATPRVLRRALIGAEAHAVDLRAGGVEDEIVPRPRAQR